MDDQHYMMQALAEARKATDRDEVPVGAVVVCKDRIIVTHSMDEAYSLSRRMLIMDRGNVIDEGRTESIFGHPSSERSARIMGFRNIAAAYPEDGGTISIPGWNLRVPGTGGTVSAACLMEGDIMMELSVPSVPASSFVQPMASAPMSTSPVACRKNLL